MEIVEHASPLAFDATVERLTQAIAAAGMTLFATFDHAANAEAVGLAMPPTKVLVYGNPRGGTPVMLAAPLAALDLPLRVLIREREDGGAAIAFHPLAALAPAQQLLLNALAK